MNTRAPRGRWLIRHQFIQHSVQVRCSQFDVEVFGLAGAGFGRQHAATMDLMEVAIRELVTTLVVVRQLVVFAQVPLAKLRDAVFPDELIFRRARGLMLAPVVALIEHALPFLDELLGVLERALDQV